MSLPSNITFLTKQLRILSTEFYNAGWYVPDTVGKDISELYSEERWHYVIAYGNIYDRKGYEIGKVSNSITPTSNLKNSIKGVMIDWFQLDLCANLKRKLDTPQLANMLKVEDVKPIKIKTSKLPRLPDLLFRDVIGVQPMTAPTGQIFKMKVRHSDDLPKKLHFTEGLEDWGRTYD